MSKFMQRCSDWPGRLDAFLAANRAREFRYGSWDCFQFVCGAVFAMTAVDLAAPFPPYRSRFAYLRQMRRYCDSASLIAFAEKWLCSFGLAEVEVPRAGRGDLVLIGGIDPAFGLVALNGRAALVLSPAGEIVRTPLASAVAAWRI